MKTEIRRDARGRNHTFTGELAFASPQVFDMAYSSKTHHRFVLQELRSLLRPRRFDLWTPKTARMWKDAILRGAPLLKGFFHDEPQHRDKMLRWCMKILEQST